MHRCSVSLSLLTSAFRNSWFGQSGLFDACLGLPTHRCARDTIKERAERKRAQCPAHASGLVSDSWDTDFDNAVLARFCAYRRRSASCVEYDHQPVGAFATTRSLRQCAQVLDRHSPLVRKL